MKTKVGTLKIKNTNKEKNEEPKWIKTLRTFGGSTGYGFEKIER